MPRRRLLRRPHQVQRLQCSSGNLYVYIISLQSRGGTDFQKVTPTDDNVWLGAPNTTALNTTSPPTWSNLTFSVPGTGSSEHNVGFLDSNSTSSDRQSSGFTFYGTFIFVESSTGGMESLWYATPSSIDGIYSLKWNETGDSTDEKIVLTLKKSPPSNASKSKSKSRSD